MGKQLNNLSTMTDHESKQLIALEMEKLHPDWHLVERLSRGEVDSNPSSVRFSVDAGHIQRLGMELVAKQETALAELVKNAYDADATRVTVSFSNHDRPDGTLVIEDNGLGMTAEAVRDAWMRLSTTSKHDAPTSPRYGRTRAGRKGIGRFSVQRLGKELILETEVSGSDVGFRAHFDWDGAFKAGENLYDVFSEIETYSKPVESERTCLTIKGLRESWSEPALQRVWRNLLLLQPPFQVSETPVVFNSITSTALPDPGFEVVLNGVSRRNQRMDVGIDSGFLDYALADISGGISDDGTAFVRLSSRKLEISEEYVFDQKFLLTGALDFSAKYFIYLASDLSGLAVSIAQKMGREYGGIRIYRNGFRVSPYGDRADDWLKLDRDTSRRAIIVPANNSNFFGQVHLTSNANPLFDETSSREGLIENEAFEELRVFVRESVEWALLRLAHARGRKQTAGQKGFVSAVRVKPPSEAINELIEELDGAVLNPLTEDGDFEKPPQAMPLLTTAKLESIRVAAVAWEQKVLEEKQASLQYEEMLRILASLGLSVAIFGHEVKGTRGTIAAHLTVIERDLSDLEDSRIKNELIKTVTGLKTSTGRMFDLGGYIAGLMSSTETRELKTLSVKGSIDRFVEQFSEYMGRQKIEFEVDIRPDQLRTIEMHSSELDAVLLNFLTNSIKSMKKAKSFPRKIKISARQDSRHILLGFQDNGTGITPEMQDRIFDAFFTTSVGVDDDGLAGPGTGLGLKIVSDIATSYGGSVQVGNPSDGYTCNIEFRVLSSGSDKS